MRIAGWLLLVVGLLLCISIVWATIGFLMMGFGLICLLIAERGRARTTAVAARPAMATEPSFQRAEEPPAPAPKPRPAMVSRANVVSSAIDKIRQDNPSYDAEKWNALVGSDPDIARLVEALTPYGRQYVDELATVYLTLNDKDYLPVIVDEIVASARRNAGLDRAQDVTADASDANSARRSKSAGSRSSRSRDLLKAAGAPREPVAVDHVAVEPDTRQVPTAPVADSSSAPASVAVAATSDPEPVKIAPEPVVTATPAAVPGTEAIGKIDLDDAKDLRELFKQLGSA